MIVKIYEIATETLLREVPIDGENFALGLAAVKHTCPRCGTSRFVDGGDEVECNCGLRLVYIEDEAEMTGYLHARDDVEPSRPEP